MKIIKKGNEEYGQMKKSILLVQYDNWFTSGMGGGGVFFRMENVKVVWFTIFNTHTNFQSKWNTIGYGTVIS